MSIKNFKHFEFKNLVFIKGGGDGTTDGEEEQEDGPDRPSVPDPIGGGND